MSTSPIPLHELETPCFIVDELRAIANCNTMRQKTEAKGVRLRPHQKTHKTKELALATCGGDKTRGIVVSTLTEAEFYANDGFQDILYAYPPAVHRLPRCQSLAAKIDHFHLIVDNEEILKDLNANPVHGKSSSAWSVFMYINVGYRREGVMWDSEEVVRMATQIKEFTNIKLTGLYTHCGHSYSAGSKTSAHRVAEETFLRMSEVNRRLVEIGFQNLVVSMGSTPSCSAISAADNFDMVNEIHPGNYVFYDWENLTVGSCEETDIACWVMTRIVGLYPHQNLILVDCGFTALCHDRSLKWQQIGFANIIDHPELKMEGMTQELGKITSIDGAQLDFSKYKLGQLLFLQPWHSCATAAMHSQYHIVRLGRSSPVQGTSLREAIYHPCREWGPL